ncbi:MAG: hypothetical protein GW778_01875 [Alphaproteobacteria bacterium]|nr:hypothetical protein [Alphaproteobacteria bacterium]
MALDLGKGMRKISEAQSALISQAVTEEAQRRMAQTQAELEQAKGI